MPQTVTGLLAPGNIDLAHRPKVRNLDGSTSTVNSISVNVDGHEVLIPTVLPDGRMLSPQDAVRHYLRTGQHLGIFDSAEHATAYAQQLHAQQAEQLQPIPWPGPARLAEALTAVAQSFGRR
jgi:hypothetical protein